MTNREIREVTDVQHYTGGEHCHYGCGDPAEFIVEGTDGVTTYTFAGCQDCLNDAHIHPIANDWVDERTDYHQHA